jgi:hypothetical protein
VTAGPALLYAGQHGGVSRGVVAVNRL